MNELTGQLVVFVFCKRLQSWHLPLLGNLLVNLPQPRDLALSLVSLNSSPLF